MGFTIDVDTGGTFTDAFVTAGQAFYKLKTDTTPEDLTICFLKSIEKAAEILGLLVEDFLDKTEVIRYSTTVGTNAIIQKSGPRLGLLVTKGYEDSLYGSEAIWEFITREMVVGLDDNISPDGSVGKEISDHEVRTAVEHILDHGARGIVVALKGSFYNSHNEKQVKNLINTEYPRHYLGSVPTLIACELCNSEDDAVRLNMAFLSAYLRPDMIRYLYKADEELRKRGFRKPLLIAHANGGAARVAKTSVLNTYNSGPACGLFGAAYMVNNQYKHENAVLAVDVGGTSVDVGVIRSGSPKIIRKHTIEGLVMDFPIVDVIGLPGGGGAIASVQLDKVIVGPESAGAYPGPACYDIGGELPTVTDADLVLGYLDPEYFLGGQRSLNLVRAQEAIERHIASKLHVTVEEAAAIIKNTVEEQTARRIEDFLSNYDIAPKEAILFSYGGGGGLRCSNYAKVLGIRRVISFRNSPVFSAFGASTLDVVHEYQEVKAEKLRSAESIRDTLENLLEQAYRDMRGELFAPEKVVFSLEIEDMTGHHHLEIQEKTVSAEEISRLAAKWGDRGVRSLELRAVSPIVHYSPFPRELTSESPSPRVFRNIFWSNAFVETPIYRRAEIVPGNRIPGPALIEAEDTTISILPGWAGFVDSFENLILEANAV